MRESENLAPEDQEHLNWFGYTITHSIREWRDLEKYGIDVLTGEACGYSLRLLCDLTASGCELMRSFLGGHVGIAHGSNWNSGSKTDPHIASVLLPRGILDELAAFVLLERTHGTGVYLSKDGTFAYLGELPERRREHVRMLRRPSESLPSRNVHQMSGRVE
jgi:hypothetical protein